MPLNIQEAVRQDQEQRQRLAEARAAILRLVGFKQPIRFGEIRNQLVFVEHRDEDVYDVLTKLLEDGRLKRRDDGLVEGIEREAEEERRLFAEARTAVLRLVGGKQPIQITEVRRQLELIGHEDYHIILVAVALAYDGQLKTRKNGLMVLPC